MNLRSLAPGDRSAILQLYRAVAAVPGSGLARALDEISHEYIDMTMQRAMSGGVIIGAFDDKLLVGEIHAMPIGPRQFSHVLSDLTVAAHPEARGKGVGTALFNALIERARALRVTRIELVARSGNARAIALYEHLGFKREGCFSGRVRLPEGHIEDDIPMALML